MPKVQQKAFKKALSGAHQVVIVTHFNPDGDAMGSSLALYHILTKLGKKATVIVPNPYPDFLTWLPGTASVCIFSESEEKALKLIKKADLIFTLDFNALKRLEGLGEAILTSTCDKVLIDHHQQPEDFAKYAWHDVKATSTCELVYRFMSDLGLLSLLDKKIAACLYTGLMTDTGSFRFPGVNSETHRILASLIETGIKPTTIHSAVYDNNSVSRMKLLGYALSEKMKLVEGYPAAYISLTKEELRRFDFKKGDTEGIVNYPLSIAGIQVSALFSEGDGVVKVSLRSKGAYDMNKFARKYFNGGGHINAAGGKSDVTVSETEARFINTVKELF